MIHCWTVHSSQRNQQKLSLSEFNSTQHERRIAKAYANDQIGIATKLHLNTEIITDSKDLGTNCSVAQDFISENIYKLPGFIPLAEFPSRPMPQTRTKQLLQISISMQILLEHCSSRLLLAINDNCT
jgi:hypothetical protein